MPQIPPGKFVEAEELEAEKTLRRRACKGGRGRLAEEASAALVR